MNSFRCSFVGGCSGTVGHIGCCFPRCLKAPDISFFSKIGVGDLQHPSIEQVSRVTASAELKTRYKFSITRHTL